MTQTECDSEMRAITKELLALAERLHQLQINRPGAKSKPREGKYISEYFRKPEFMSEY